MELQLYMLKQYDDKTISEITGIGIKTITDWRAMMYELETAGIRVKPDIKHSPEKQIQTRFAKTLDVPYQEYVKTKYGIIDILTDYSIYEVKVDINNSTIHRPVGQVLLYSTELNNRAKVIVARSIRVSEYVRNAVNNLGVQLVEFS